MVYAKKMKGKKALDESMVFSVGKPQGADANSYFGITAEEYKERKKDSTDPFQLKKFDDCRVRGLAAGLKCSFIFTDSPK